MPITSPIYGADEDQESSKPLPLYSSMRRDHDNGTFNIVATPPFPFPMVVPSPEASTDSSRHTRQQLLAFLEVADQSFYENEIRRDEAHNDNLKSYAGRSEQAERERSLADKRREEQFRYMEHRIWAEFNSSLEYFTAEFQSKEISRKAGHEQRSRELKSLQEFFLTQIRQLEEAFLERVKILVDTEDQAVADYKAPIARLIYDIEHRIFSTRQFFNDMFVNALRRFGFHVSIPPIPPPDPFVELEAEESHSLITHVLSKTTTGPVEEIRTLRSEALFVSRQHVWQLWPLFA